MQIPGSPAYAASLRPTAEVQGWLARVLPDTHLDSVKDQVTGLPFTGQTLHEVKARDLAADASGQPHPVHTAFDGNGNLLEDGGKALLDAEATARWQARGGIQPDLWDHLGQVPPGSKIPVAIWLRSDEPVNPPRDEFKNPYAVAADRVDRVLAHGQAFQAFKSQASQFADVEWHATGGAPVVTGELTPEQVRGVAWLPQVGWIDWVRPVEPQGNLTSWYNSALAAPSLTGKYGSGLNVCVLENKAPQSPNSTISGSGWGTSPASGENFADYLDGLGLQAGNLNDAYGRHSRSVIGALQTSSSPNGFAPSSRILLANFLVPGFEVGADWCAADNQYYGTTYIWNDSNACDAGNLCNS
jgi:hypothetical protein